ncbi:nuclear elongation and deformation protein-like protein 1 [Lepidopterella palustris CBS 459.81]|uniref:Nuclear elongation and deformation protein-like protein 1 n=1 Tax=Lepidopterella palustris CBS 459.81 TaxID=1314670 RepID=A0A8E2EID9_9PEZI|nr:nuclear elongation and deformation protein-like protein 1 [Lepidopterella palustris CBS 459.81]
MQYVRSISGSVSKTWNSINPATLSGAIDVIVVEQADGSLACSPFHVRFGKFSLLRPSDKKVEFRVNDVKQNYSMKLGEGGEAFFVFETSASIPADLQTSPLVSPASSPESKPIQPPTSRAFPDPDLLDLAADTDGTNRRREPHAVPPLDRQSKSFSGNGSLDPNFSKEAHYRAKSDVWSGVPKPSNLGRSVTDDVLPPTKAALSKPFDTKDEGPMQVKKEAAIAWNISERSASPPPVSTTEAMTRAINLSKKLWVSNIPTQVTDRGDLMLDMTGYKSSEEESLRAEVIARKILSDELEGNYDIGALIGADEKGNLWIYSSEEAKQAAGRQAALNSLNEDVMRSTDAISDPGYHSDDGQSDSASEYTSPHLRRDSDSAVGLTTPPKTPDPNASAGDPNRNYAKTLRLTSEQLQALNLKPGANSMSFSVNRATCTAYMYYWKHDVPIVISDIDGTITKSDALGHVLNMIGRDWTHLGVAKLYTDIVNNGYNIFYLTSRSVGQADTTRTYLNGVVQDGYRLPKGPTIMSPDRTIAALRREIYLRKPEVFKMACLRDIMNLFGKTPGQTPFYAGFGNRLTDALSYRSVNIPSTRIFTINSNAEVSLDLLSLNKYKTGYASMREIVDHFFPPVGLLVPAGGEEYTDFNYWRDKPLDLEEFSDSESENDEDTEAGSLPSEDEGTEDIDGVGEDLEASYFSRESVDETGDLGDSIIESVEGDDLESSVYLDDEAEGEEDEEEEEEQSLDPAMESTPTPPQKEDPITNLQKLAHVPNATTD